MGWSMGRLMLVPILFSSYVCSPCPPFCPTPIPRGFVSMDSQWLEGIVAGTLETPPFIFPSLSLALFVSLNLATVIFSWLNKKCFQWLGVRGTHPSQFSTVHTFRFAVLAPSGWLVIHVMQAFWSVSNPEEWRTTCPARCYKGLCLVDHGTPLEREGENRAQRGTSWKGRKQRTGQGQVTWGAVLFWLHGGWVICGDFKRDPASNFPLPFPELVQG